MPNTTFHEMLKDKTTAGRLSNFHRPLVIYHGGCADGAGAALAAYLLFGEDAEYRPAVYGDPVAPTDAEARGRIICILDFSYTREVIERLQRAALCLIVIDHHKTAAERLSGIPGFVIEMDRSGAALAWREMIGGPMPELFRYIEDRDLWRWHLPHSREISVALVAREAHRDFRIMKAIYENWQEEHSRLVVEGTALIRLVNQQVARMTASAEPVILDGVSALATNATAFHSEVGDELAARAPIGITWGWNGKRQGYVVSLRSTGAVDVSQIAVKYGGGGHRNAASFVCDRLPWTATTSSINEEAQHAA